MNTASKKGGMLFKNADMLHVNAQNLTNIYRDIKPIIGMWRIKAITCHFSNAFLLHLTYIISEHDF